MQRSFRLLEGGGWHTGRRRSDCRSNRRYDRYRKILLVENIRFNRKRKDMARAANAVKDDSEDFLLKIGGEIKATICSAFEIRLAKAISK